MVMVAPVRLICPINVVEPVSCLVSLAREDDKLWLEECMHGGGKVVRPLECTVFYGCLNVISLKIYKTVCTVCIMVRIVNVLLPYHVSLVCMSIIVCEQNDTIQEPPSNVIV